MARKSRSSQRGPGVGTRSGTGGGPSKGGSRSSAGTGGGSKSGGNRSGSGKKSGGTKNSGGSSKGPSGGGTKKGGKRQSGPPSKTPAPPKKTIQQKKDDNIKSMRDKAKKRHEQFKKTGFQTHGGRFAKDDKGRVYDTRKKQVQDAAKKRHQKFVQARKDKAVDKKSAKLAAATGIPTKPPAGSFGISAAGREQAAANRMAAQQAMNLNTGLNIGSKPKYKDGQRIASNYMDGGEPSPYQQRQNARDILNSGMPLTDKQKSDLMKQATMQLKKVDAGTFGIGDAVASLNPAAQLGNLISGTPVSAAQDTGGEGAAGTPESGGLSIGQNQEATSNPLSRALQIAGNIGQEFMSDPLGYAKTGLGFAADIANQAFSPSLADGTLRGNMDLGGRLPGDAGFNQQDVNTKAAINAALNSQGVNQFGQSLGLPKNFQAQTRGVVDALTDNFTGATADRDGVYGGVSETLRTLSQDDRLAPVSKFLGQLGTDNENVSDAERNQNFKIAGFNTPFTNETVADIVSSFQPNVTKMPGLSKEDRGVLEGGIGNRLVSGKFTDAAREALTGYGGDSVANLGLERGTPLSIANVYDAGRLMAQNAAADGTLADRRFTEIANLADPSGRITGPSIIKGITGFGTGSSSGSNKPGANIPGANQPAPTLVPEEILEFLEPTIPTTDTSEMSLPEFVDPTDAYNDALNEFLYNPNYFPEVQQAQKKPVKTFAQTFNRDYF